MISLFNDLINSEMNNALLAQTPTDLDTGFGPWPVVEPELNPTYKILTTDDP